MDDRTLPTLPFPKGGVVSKPPLWKRGVGGVPSNFMKTTTHFLGSAQAVHNPFYI